MYPPTCRNTIVIIITENVHVPWNLMIGFPARIYSTATYMYMYMYVQCTMYVMSGNLSACGACYSAITVSRAVQDGVEGSTVAESSASHLSILLTPRSVPTVSTDSTPQPIAAYLYPPSTI